MQANELVNMLAEQGFKHPRNLIFAFLSGSHQHGAKVKESDIDVSGVWIGDPLQEIALGNQDPKRKGHFTGGTADQYERNEPGDKDLKIYTLRYWASLALKGNPNILSYLFTPAEICDPQLMSSVWYTHILRNRDLFLASGHATAFLGLGQSQYGRMIGTRGSGKHGQRPEKIAEFGYDCYAEDETEFLTPQGWKGFDDIGASDEVASFDVLTGELHFEVPVQRIDKEHSGTMYVVEPQLTRCVVTPNHNMVVSPASRNPRTGFSTQLNPQKTDWHLQSFSTLMSGVKHRVIRSMYHIRRSVTPRSKVYDVESEYLTLAGMYLSEGSIDFRKDKVKGARIVQTPEGKEEYYKIADRLISMLQGHRYDYPREHVEYETIWTIPRKYAERLYADFGHHKDKHLPDWCFHLSYDQAWDMWNGLCLGDGTRTKEVRGMGQGTVLYTSVKQLADDVQAMMVSSGHLCVVNGAYERNDSDFGTVAMYQVYRPDDQNPYRCVNFKSGILKAGGELKEKYGYPIKEVLVSKRRIVCFEMPSGTLVTRSQGRPAFQGNSKAAMHMIRSMTECLELLQTGYMTFPRPEKDMLIDIRLGKWSLSRIEQEYLRLEAEVKAAEKTSLLPPKCDQALINELVVTAMFDHWEDKGLLARPIKGWGEVWRRAAL